MVAVNKRLQQKLKTLPRAPGVYFHKSASGEIIYVGKAAVLKNRVRQYFQDSRGRDNKTMALVAEIADTDWIETESEVDALFLESEMVKRYMPRYNRQRRPGQSKLDEDLGLSPRLSDGSAAYKANLRKLISYIKGNRKAIAAELERDMKTVARLHDFERAADLRNKLSAMRELQRRVCFGDKEFLDISKDKALADLAKLLSLKNIPVRIEGYDISHMSGRQVVASMVVFTNGASDRAEYRKFKVSEKNDDTGNIYETIFRRLSERNLKSWGRPDLLLIDGGKGQLAAAIKARDERGVTVPIISIAKREEELLVHKTGSQIDIAFIEQVRSQPRTDIMIHEDGDVYVVNLHPSQRNAGSHSKNLRASTEQNYKEPPEIEDNNLATTDIVKLFQRIRDESHRFAVSYHTVLKRQQQTKNQLEEIPGVGPKTRAKLLKKFGSINHIRNASLTDLEKIVGKELAKKIMLMLSS